MNTSSWNGTWARLLSRREYPNLASRRKTEGERKRKREREMGTYREQLLARGGSTIFNARKLHQLEEWGYVAFLREIVRCLYSPGWALASRPGARLRWHVYVHTGCLVIYGVNGGDSGSKQINWKRGIGRFGIEIKFKYEMNERLVEYVCLNIFHLCFDRVQEF